MTAVHQDITTVLVSGGLDSMGCIFFYKENGNNIDGLFIDYGQKAARKEKEAAQRISSYFDIPLSIIKVNGLSPYISGTGSIRGRNMALLILGLMNAKSEVGSISIGIHSGTDYSDCTSSFVELAQNVFNLYSNGKFTVGSPFIEWSKMDIWEYCKLNKLPTELTYSCELGLDQPCDICKSCKDRVALNAS